MPRTQNAAPAAPAAEKARPLKVRATKLTFYDNARRRPGDVFQLRSPSDFKKSCMQPVEATTPVRTTSPQDALRERQRAQKGLPHLQPNAADPVEGNDAGDDTTPRKSTGDQSVI